MTVCEFDHTEHVQEWNHYASRVFYVLMIYRTTNTVFYKMTNRISIDWSELVG